MIDQDELACSTSALASQVCLEPALPVRVTERSRARRDGELFGHEVIVCYGIGGEMRQVAEGERAQRIVARAVEDLHAYRPRVTVAPDRRVFLGDTRVRGDRSIQEVVWEFAQQLGDGQREQRQGSHDCL